VLRIFGFEAMLVESLREVNSNVETLHAQQMDVLDYYRNKIKEY